MLNTSTAGNAPRCMGRAAAWWGQGCHPPAGTASALSGSRASAEAAPRPRPPPRERGARRRAGPARGARAPELRRAPARAAAEQRATRRQALRRTGLHCCRHGGAARAAQLRLKGAAWRREHASGAHCGVRRAQPRWTVSFQVASDGALCRAADVTRSRSRPLQAHATPSLRCGSAAPPIAPLASAARAALFDERFPLFLSAGRVQRTPGAARSCAAAPRQRAAMSEANVIVGACFGPAPNRVPTRMRCAAGARPWLANLHLRVDRQPPWLRSPLPVARVRAPRLIKSRARACRRRLTPSRSARSRGGGHLSRHRLHPGGHSACQEVLWHQSIPVTAKTLRRALLGVCAARVLESAPHALAAPPRSWRRSWARLCPAALERASRAVAPPLSRAWRCFSNFWLQKRLIPPSGQPHTRINAAESGARDQQRAWMRRSDCR